MYYHEQTFYSRNQSDIKSQGELYKESGGRNCTKTIEVKEGASFYTSIRRF